MMPPFTSTSFWKVFDAEVYVRLQKPIATVLAAMLAAPAVTLASGGAQATKFDKWQDKPIKHIVVIFGENISFDHYFGTYPNALESQRASRAFHAAAGTPTVNGLKGALLTQQPESQRRERRRRDESVSPEPAPRRGPLRRITTTCRSRWPSTKA